MFMSSAGTDIDKPLDRLLRSEKPRNINQQVLNRHGFP